MRRREDRLDAIREAKARLEVRGRQPEDEERDPTRGRGNKRAYGEPEEKSQDHFTDPESRIMKTLTEGYQQCYNAQLAVDGEHQMIVSAQVSWNLGFERCLYAINS